VFPNMSENSPCKSPNSEGTDQFVTSRITHFIAAKKISRTHFGCG